jgi:hypothetical protein
MIFISEHIDTRPLQLCREMVMDPDFPIVVIFPQLNQTVNHLKLLQFRSSITTIICWSNMLANNPCYPRYPGPFFGRLAQFKEKSDEWSTSSQFINTKNIEDVISGRTCGRNSLPKIVRVSNISKCLFLGK